MTNSKIHYRYAISYLVLAIVLLLALRYYDVPDLVGKLSFALTLSSLLLAILAIFYTIISAYKQESQFTKLIETNYDLKATAKEIKTASENINITLSDFPSHFKKLGLKIDDLAEKYSSSSPEESDSKDKKKDHLRRIELNIDKAIFQKMIVNLQFEAMAVLYLFSQSSYKGKNIHPSSFDQLEIISSDYAIGFLHGFEMTGLIDFKLHQNAIIPVLCDEIIYDELRPALESVIAVIAKSDAEKLKRRLEKIDNLLA
jgi:hypothetical protein